MPRPMKDSGVEWLGDIPTDWTIIKLKYVFSIIGGNGFPDMLQGNTEGDYPFCKVSDINGEGDYVETASNWVSQSVVDSKRFNIIPTGSIIMAKIGAALAKNHRKINKVKCCIDNNNQALVPIRADDIRFLFYLSKCVDMSWFDNNSTVPSINNPKLLNFFVPFPPLEEQQHIATFLDGKCARIDSVIEKTRASIEEYKKLKQSLITRAVTKGIRPARPMKHSGVEWIGDIPSDWKVIKLKYLFSIIGGNGFPDILQGETYGDYPFCKVSDINGEADYVDTASNWVSQAVVDGNRFNVIPIGSIIMAKIGAALTKNHRKINKVKCCIDNNTQALVPRRNDDLRYLFHLSKCIDMSWFDNNSTVPSVNNPKLVNFFVPVPPLEEQKEIAQYLDEKTAAIDLLVWKKNQLVTELERLKKSLIFEYVTGKKAVAI